MPNLEKILLAGRCGLLAALIGAGTWAYSEMKPHRYATDETHIGQPDAAYDAILRGTLRQYGESPQLAGPAHPTAALRQAIRQLPPGDGILFLGSFQNPGHLSLRLITGALSWPQPVFNPGCSDANPGDPPPPDFNAAGAIYYHAAPPAGLPAQLFLPEMFVTRAPEKIAWNSYCPR